eukprot:s2753_g4.t1
MRRKIQPLKFLSNEFLTNTSTVMATFILIYIFFATMSISLLFRDCNQLSCLPFEDFPKTPTHHYIITLSSDVNVMMMLMTMAMLMAMMPLMPMMMIILIMVMMLLLMMMVMLMLMLMMMLVRKLKLVMMVALVVSREQVRTALKLELHRQGAVDLLQQQMKYFLDLEDAYRHSEIFEEIAACLFALNGPLAALNLLVSLVDVDGRVFVRGAGLKAIFEMGRAEAATLQPVAGQILAAVESFLEPRRLLGFRSFQSSRHGSRDRRSTASACGRQARRPLIDKVNSYKSWSKQEHGHFEPSDRTVIALSNFICELDCASYMLSNNQKLMIAMLLGGHRWRAHQQQIFKYENGAWIMEQSLDIKAWDPLLALEGLFIHVALSLQGENASATWSWLHAGHHRGQVGGADLLQVSSGMPIGRVDAQTCWLSYAAAGKRRKQSTHMSKLFLKERDTPTPESKGLCFDDVYLDASWNVAPKSPEANCYFRLDYSYFHEIVLAKYEDLGIAAVGSQLTAF